ncbi:MAG: hypothetical protein ACMXYC_00950 [Candidatus Woesearchaeota archaeon]
MSGFIDIGLLSGANLLFAFLFVFLIVFAVIGYSNIFGDANKSIAALIAFVIAVMTIFSSDILRIISFIIPWFTLMVIVIVFILLVFMTMGVKASDITKIVVESKDWSNTIAIWVLVLSSFIIAGGIGIVFFSGDSAINVNFAPSEGTVVDGEVEGVGVESFFATLFHPKILGFVLVMLIGVFVVQQLGKGGIV